MLELRRVDRDSVDGKIRLNWRDQMGATFGSMGRLVEVSTGGVRVDLDRRIEIGLTVQIESSDLKVAGLAVVRHCRQKGMGFRLGLQFGDGPKQIRRKPSESPAAGNH
jgi:hypothetical protein